MPLIPGSVSLTGFIAPTDSADTFAVTNPIYGLGGLRTVPDLVSLSAITSERREPGMIVYVSGETQYYKLNSGLTNSDWIVFSLGGGSGFSGWTASTGLFSIIANNNSVNIAGNYSVVGGMANSATTNYSFIGSGKLNLAAGAQSVVGGGRQNTAYGTQSSIVGGRQNKAFGTSSFVGGGSRNISSGNYSTIVAGSSNFTYGNSAFIGAGQENSAMTQNSIVVGGLRNIVSGAVSYFSSIVGGTKNYINQGSGSFIVIEIF
jgi:hypothetical protein